MAYYARPPNFCHECGKKYEHQSAAVRWPVKCGACGTEVYSNPFPVSVALTRVGDGILGVRRNIGPGKGELALPGGFHNAGETWQEAGSRELWEETGLELPASDVSIFDCRTGNGKHQLTFCEFGTRLDELPEFDASKHDETQELVVLDGSQKLCFPAHDEIYRLALTRNEETARLEVEIAALEAELRLARAKVGRR